MTAPVIETRKLSKRYGDVPAVIDVDLEVQAGELYAFLGLNGAGKSTTIRALLGMIRPSEGTVQLFGRPLSSWGNLVWRRVGHLVEHATAYPELTVRENLEIARRLTFTEGTSAVDEIIERLQLSTYAHRRAGTLSTGNLQRLGLARALLHQPELLILDEPANDLDPAGVVEVRELLRGLAREHGVTIFMSSHILSEVDRLADRIGIIHEGRLIEELDSEELERRQSAWLSVRTGNLKKAREALESAGYHTAMLENALRIEDERAVEHPDEVARILVEAGAPPTRLVVEREDLEAHFLRLTSGRLS